MADDSSDPSGELSILDLALAYARYGLRIFPVHTTDKSPMPGYGWYELASSQTNHVVEDFDRAQQLWHDQVSIAWALGRDRCLAVDVDVDGSHLPPWMPELVASAVINITRRGQHLIFRMPDDNIAIGNGTSNFPSQGWGEVRGQGGYIIIAGPDRPGLDLGEMVKLVAFPRPEYLALYGGPVDAVSKAELLEFANAHTTASNVNMLNGVRAALDKYTADRDGDPAKGRHPLAVWAMCEVADESLAGFYAFKDGFKLVQEWWRSVTPPERHGREWLGICCWAVGRALSKQHPPTDEGAGDEPEALLDDNTVPQLVAERIDWSEFWTEDSTIAEWLIEGFWPLGKRIGVYAEPAQGKSEWALWCAVCIVTGHNPATGERLGPERGVLYLDYEMDADDLRDRLESFGMTGRNLTGLCYDQLPTIAGVDTQRGRAAILDAVKYLGAEAVIIDTYGMAIEGPENEADTVHAVLRDLGNPLKAMGVGLWIVHHAGKNKDQGGRGSSALAGQVDVMWLMERVYGSNETLLSCTGRGRKRRQSWVPDRLRLVRTETDDGTVAYTRAAEIAEMVMNATITALVHELEAAGIDPQLTQRETITALGRSPKTTNLAAAMRYRREFYQRYPQGRIGLPGEGIKDDD